MDPLTTIQLPGALRDVAVTEVFRAARAGLAPATGAPQQSREADIERARLVEARRAIEQAAGRIGELEDRLREEAEQHAADLAMEIARKVLMQEIQAQRYQIEPIVREAMSRVPNGARTGPIVVRLNPDDLRRCEAPEPPDTSGLVRFVGDPAVPHAGCVVETAEGIVESSVEAHLKEIETVLRSE